MTAEKLEQLEQRLADAQIVYNKLLKEQQTLQSRIREARKGRDNMNDMIVEFESRRRDATDSIRQDTLDKELAIYRQIFDGFESNIKEILPRLTDISERGIEARAKCHSLSREVARERVVLDQQLAQERKQQEELERHRETEAQKLREQQREELERRRETEAQGRREVLVVELKRQLQDYKDQRSALYQVKDILTAVDKGNREYFIDITLTKQIVSYIESGNSESVLSHIDANKHLFPGVHMQSTLNKVAITLLDFVDAEQNLSSQSTKDVVEILSAHKEHPRGKAYAAKIEQLYAAIEGMSKFGQGLSNTHEQKVITELAMKLRHDVDRFVRQHETTPPDVDASKKFTERFKIRLHSEDSLMSKYEDRWLVILANIAAALTVIGAALLIHTKVKTGATPLFFSATQKQTERAKVEKTLDSGMAEQGPAEDGGHKAPDATI